MSFSRFLRPSAQARIVVILIVAVLQIWGTAVLAPALAQVDGAAQPAPVSVAELESLVGTLQDEEARGRLVGQLRALIDSRRATAPVEPDAGLGARLLERISSQIDRVGAEAGRAAELAIDAPRLFRWLQVQVGDPDARARWGEIAVKLLAVLATGLAAEWLVRRLLARPREALDGRHVDRLLLRLPFLLVRAVLELLPVLAFAVAAYTILPALDPTRPTRLVALAFVNANVVARIIVAVGRLLLAPDAPGLRLFPIGSHTAQYLFLWHRRLTHIGVYGYFLAEVLAVLRAPPAAYRSVLQLLGLVLMTLLVILILQNRDPVAAAIRGRPRKLGSIHALRSRLADIWHVLAIVYVVGAFVVYVLDLEGGFESLFRATAVTVIVLAAARGLAGLLRGVLRRGFAVSAELRQRYPALEAQANRYVPILQWLLVGLLYFVAAIAILEAWGLDAFDWVASPGGRGVFGSAFKITVLVSVALGAWLLATAAIERYLHKTDAEGRAVTRSARMRTLLPLLQRVLFIILAVLLGLIVLSEIGINIAPLLAGAGIVGLAVGFGAQSLVKDVITGVFILLEDQFAVGDVVNVGGKGGLVEAISIRTLRLRDQSGTVHVIPFSEVGSTQNLTKDFSYYLLKVGVSYREDTDEVVQVLRELAAELEKDPVFGPRILPPFEVLGVDEFADSAVIIVARIKTLPIQQWSVGREFNRRMKKRFDELGIEIPFPHQTIYFGVDKKGAAPPAHVALTPPDATPAPG